MTTGEAAYNYDVAMNDAIQALNKATHYLEIWAEGNVQNPHDYKWGMEEAAKVRKFALKAHSLKTHSKESIVID